MYLNSNGVAAIILMAVGSHAFCPPISRGTCIIAPTTTSQLYQSIETETLKKAMLRNPSQSKDIMIYQLYEDWRQKHNKGEFDTNRFMEFKSNYLQLQKNHERAVAIAKRDRREPPTLPELNQHADLTIAEYHRLLKGSQHEEGDDGGDDTNKDSPIRNVPQRAYWEDEIKMPVTSPSVPKITPRTSMKSSSARQGGTKSHNTTTTSSPPGAQNYSRTNPQRTTGTTTSNNNKNNDSKASELSLKQAMLRNPSQSKDIMIYQMYQDWRQKHNKGEFDTNRFMEFKSNYMLLQTNYEKAMALAKMERRELPLMPEINAYADLTEAEYHRALLNRGKEEDAKGIPHSTVDEMVSTKKKVSNDDKRRPKPKKKVAPRTSIQSSSSSKKPKNDDGNKEGNDGSDVTEKQNTPVSPASTPPQQRRNAKTMDSTNDLKQAMLKNPSQSKEIMIYQLYEDWRRKNNKGEFVPHRFMEFKSNYMKMQRNHERSVAIAKMQRQPLPRPPEINEYADLTEAEYHRLMKTRDTKEIKVEITTKPDAEETKDAPQVIVWGPEGNVSASASKRSDGIREPYVGRTKHAAKAMPPIRVSARTRDQVSQEPGSAAQQRRYGPSTSTAVPQTPTQLSNNLQPVSQEIRRHPKKGFAIRSAISKGSSSLSVDNRGADADRMAVDFPERIPPIARGIPRTPGISDQETRIPLKTVDPSSSYAAHNKVDLRKMPDVPGVSDQETKLPPKRVSTDYYTQARMKPEVNRAVPGVSYQETRTPSSNVDPSRSNAGENKQALRKMSVVPNKGSTGSLSRQRIDQFASYPREMPQARHPGVSDQEHRVPGDIVDTDPYSQARRRPTRFSAMQGKLKSLDGKPPFRVPPESLSNQQGESGDDEPNKAPMSPDQRARAPSTRINPDSIHAAHWPL